MAKVLYHNPVFGDRGLRHVFRSCFSNFFSQCYAELKGNNLHPASTLNYAREELTKNNIDVVFLTVHESNSSGLELLGDLDKKDVKLPVFFCRSRKDILDLPNVQAYSNICGRFEDMYAAMKSEPFNRVVEEIKRRDSLYKEPTLL